MGGLAKSQQESSKRFLCEGIHLKSDCPPPGIKCFKCQKINHKLEGKVVFKEFKRKEMWVANLKLLKGCMLLEQRLVPQVISFMMYAVRIAQRNICIGQKSKGVVLVS